MAHAWRHVGFRRRAGQRRRRAGARTPATRQPSAGTAGRGSAGRRGAAGAGAGAGGTGRSTTAAAAAAAAAAVAAATAVDGEAEAGAAGSGTGATAAAGRAVATGGAAGEAGGGGGGGGGRGGEALERGTGGGEGEASRQLFKNRPYLSILVNRSLPCVFSLARTELTPLGAAYCSARRRRAGRVHPYVYGLSFIADCSVPCNVTVHVMAYEKDRHRKDKPPRLKSKVTQREASAAGVVAGLEQTFSLPPSCLLAFDGFQDAQLTSTKTSPSHTYPVVIRIQTALPAGRSHDPAARAQQQTHTTYATLVKQADSTYGVQVLKQVLWVGGCSYVLHEIFGIDGPASSPAPLHAAPGDAADPNGGGANVECVVCLEDPRDTLVLPCRHLCLCLHFGVERMRADGQVEKGSRGGGEAGADYTVDGAEKRVSRSGSREGVEGGVDRREMTIEEASQGAGGEELHGKEEEMVQVESGTGSGELHAGQQEEVEVANEARVEAGC
ncbi:unnamed protein product [Closterium sp. Yama58-4]|nr:unnamed protein product [Closterium sp. Yama58-4]